jgi:hypothetical protein
MTPVLPAGNGESIPPAPPWLEIADARGAS